MTETMDDAVSPVRRYSPDRSRHLLNRHSILNKERKALLSALCTQVFNLQNKQNSGETEKQQLLERELKTRDEKIKSLKLGMLREKNLLLNQAEKFGDDLAALQKTVTQLNIELQQTKELARQFEDYHYDAEEMKKHFSRELDRVNEELQFSREERVKLGQLNSFLQEKRVHVESGDKPIDSSLLIQELLDMISAFSVQQQTASKANRYRSSSFGSSTNRNVLERTSSRISVFDVEAAEEIVSNYSNNSSEDNSSISSRSSSYVSSNGVPDFNVQPEAMSRRMNPRRMRAVQQKPSIASLYRANSSVSLEQANSGNSTVK